MNQQCKVCGEPAAGFHFGAFTCEGCKSFFGRSYNNLNSIADCKNDGKCVINKKNRTACKSCRLRKCIFVGMSKSGSRYGRRSNWFKIHCLLQQQQQQEQQQQQLEQQMQQQQPLQQHQQHQQAHYQPAILMSHQLSQQQRNPTTSPIHGIHGNQCRDEALMMSADEYKNSNSPNISSPESHNSDSSVDVSERRAAFAGHHGIRPLPHLPPVDLSALGLPLGFPLSGMSLLPSAFLPPPGLTMFSPYAHVYATPHSASHPLMASHPSSMLQRSPVTTSDENDEPATATTSTMTTTVATAAALRISASSTDDKDSYEKNNNNDRFCLDMVLKSETSEKPRKKIRLSEDSSVECSPEREVACPPPQDNPMDLSMKTVATSVSDHLRNEIDDETDNVSDAENSAAKKPIDLTTRS